LVGHVSFDFVVERWWCIYSIQFCWQLAHGPSAGLHAITTGKYPAWAITRTFGEPSAWCGVLELWVMEL